MLLPAREAPQLRFSLRLADGSHKAMPLWLFLIFADFIRAFLI